jgi:hypothetical protein
MIEVAVPGDAHGMGERASTTLSDADILVRCEIAESAAFPRGAVAHLGAMMSTCHQQLKPMRWQARPAPAFPGRARARLAVQLARLFDCKDIAS